MGNYCCAEDKTLPPIISSPLKKKPSLKDPSTKRKYEESIGEALNVALNKFKGDRKVHNIRIKSRLGKGGQGEVFLVEVTGFDKFGDIQVKDYAMKRVSKKKLDALRTKQALMLENQILSSYKSNFLLQIVYAFQNSSQLFYMMQIAQGGDLYSYICQPENPENCKRSLLEKKGEMAVKFILAGIILGIEYLHSKGIVYRDLKPENILLFDDGYPRLADFGVAKKFQPEQKCFELKGTVLYFSPEMVSKKGYDRGADLWALGVLLYELLFKSPPFSSASIKSKKFQSELLDLDKNIPNPFVSKDAIDLIKRLLVLNPTERIGYVNMQELKTHPFFSSIDWEKYKEKEMVSPLQEIIDCVIGEQKRKTEVINQVIETQHREDIPFNFVRESGTRETTQDITPVKKKESEAIGIEENYLKQFEEESLDEIIDKYSV